MSFIWNHFSKVQEGDEIDKYILTNCFVVNMVSYNPLEFWRGKEKSYPFLYSLARKLLIVPATSTPIESVFSVSGNLVCDETNSLDPSTIDQIMFLKYFYKILDENLNK
jgi:hypothetical protein